MPVIREFLNQGAEVELAVVKANANFFREVFPDLRQRLAPSYNIVYPKHGYNMGLWLLKNGAHLNKVIKFEHRFAEEMVERHGYDVLFSDNRFAFYSKKALSIYMTHQRRIAFPKAFSAFERIGVIWHSNIMRKFDEVWVPDLEIYPGYAGSLSHSGATPGNKPMRYVGTLSRFSENAGNVPAPVERSLGMHTVYKVVAVVSGVEPARSRFETLLRQILEKVPGRHAVILGKPSLGVKSWTEGNIDFFTHLDDARFASVVKAAEWVVSRGGYSTVMDMAVLGAKCIFVPTPGQYEQVILSRDLSRAGFAATIGESDLSVKNLLAAISENGNVSLPKPEGGNLLKNAIQGLTIK